MKRNSHSRNFNPAQYKSYDSTDTRYYGVFFKGQGKSQRILIDPIRYKKKIGISEKMKKVMDKRTGPFFRPAKKHTLDYTVNTMLKDLAEIQQRWERTNKPWIDRILSEICGKVYTIADDDLAMSGILEPDEAATNANTKTFFSHLSAEYESDIIYHSLYAEFFHQMVSQIEALFVKALTSNGYEKDFFCRNKLYKSKYFNKDIISDLKGFSEYNKMYTIWNCIKHNSLSAFSKLRDNFPELLKKDEYSQGEIACFYIKFDNKLIESILVGVETFIKEYCHLVFKEDLDEASWNSEEYFTQNVYDEIRNIVNPLGISPWI